MLRTAGAGVAAVGLVVSISAPAVADPGHHEDTHYRQVAFTRIPTPGGMLFADIIFGDQHAHSVYLSDLANSTLDIIDSQTSKLVAQAPGFTGGPAGVVRDSLGQIWAGDGAGAVKVVSGSAPYRITDSVPVDAPTADEIGYDPVDQIIAVSSPDATTGSTATPWVTLIDARPGPDGHHRVLGHVLIPNAGTDAIEQPQWDPATHSFVEAVRSTTDSPQGEVVRIDPRTASLEGTLPVNVACNPGGLAVGVDGQILLGCNTGAPAVMDLRTGAIIATFGGHNASGADEVWFNKADQRFYAAEAGAAGPPPLPQLNPPTVMVIDAKTDQFVTNIPLGPEALGFHQVTAVGNPARVFVPEADGVHVYEAAD